MSRESLQETRKILYRMNFSTEKIDKEIERCKQVSCFHNYPYNSNKCTKCNKIIR